MKLRIARKIFFRRTDAGGARAGYKGSTYLRAVRRLERALNRQSTRRGARYFCAYCDEMTDHGTANCVLPIFN